MAKKEITNIIDYLIWRGDLSFEADHFNEIDALVLSRFSYMDMKGILENEQTVLSLREAYDQYIINLDERPKFASEDPDLFRLMAESERFGSLKIKYHNYEFDSDDVEQFSALAIELSKNSHFLSFRGTDNTINGWKEDLLMTFDEIVPSQADALEYIELVAKNTSGELFLGGHSKGGNLAVYAALFSKEKVAKRIKGVFSFDGPGLHKSLVEQIDDKIALPVVATYMPQSSFFGKMLSHRELQIVVNSNASGVMQHDIYSWEVVGKSFVLAKEDTVVSRVFDQAFHDYLAKLSKEERKEVVDIIFEMIEKCEGETMEDLGEHFFSNVIKVTKHMSQLDENEVKLIKEAIAVIADSLKDGIIEEISNRIPLLKKKEDSQD